MSNRRQLIRQATKTALLSQTAAGINVFDARIRYMNANAFPAIWISTGRERSELVAESPREYRRSLTLRVEIKAQASVANPDIENTLDALAVEVEAVLNEDNDLGQGVSLVVESSDLTHLSEGKRVFAVMAMEFIADHYTITPESALDDFVTANLDIDFDNPDGQIESTDSVTLPQ